MSIGVHFPLDPFDGELAVASVQRVESLGYDSFWVSEVKGREALGTSGWLLASTTTLQIGTAVASIYARPAVVAAAGAATLAELSGGRFSLGLGVSIRWLVEQRGQTWEPPLTKLPRYLDQYSTDGLRSPQPPIPAPLYVAAHGPKMLEAVAARVDGVIVINVPPEHVAWVRSQLRDDQELIFLKTCIPDRDPAAARDRARQAVGVYLDAPQYWRIWPNYGFDESDRVPGGSDRLVDMLVAWGEPQAIGAQLQEYRDAGATQIVLRVPSDGKREDDWDLLAALAPAS